MAPRGRPRRRPAMTEEARENQMISSAIDLAEKQLMEGTASAQVITFYLKLGSSRERLEQERLMHENELLQAKSDMIAAQQRSDEMFAEAMRAFSSYAGHPQEIEEGDPGYVD